MKSEALARKNIDQMLEKSGWQVQDLGNLNLGAAIGVAVREFPLKSGFADYLLFVNRQAAGVIEAKKEGVTLAGVSEQTASYSGSLPYDIPHVNEPLPFAYESTGKETYFRDLRDPTPRSRRVFSFHQPKQLQDWLNQPDTLRARLSKLPPLVSEGFRDCQIEAIAKLEESFAQDRPRALIQMATGSGKTFTAVSFIYRLIKHANAKRILFLVDRANLGIQTDTEFQQYITPDDGRKFTELYNVQHLKSNTLDPVCRVTVCTIQRLYSMLRGEELPEDLDELSGFEVSTADERTKDVEYNPFFPIESFDFIITDECHRSIYNLWRQVLEYFDAHIIGLTATPSKQTIGFFHNNLVMEYSHERAVADGVNVGYEVYRIKTEITQKGAKVEAGHYVDKRDKLDRSTRWEQLDDDLEYSSDQLDRSVVSIDQIRTVIRTFRDKLFTDIFPGRTEVPKTLIFAKDDSHAEDITHIIREEFGKGNDFCKKITYRTYDPDNKRYEKPENLLKSFRNSFNPRIAVTVDMISTGTDVKPLECLLFMRDVRSTVYFDQMKGRGTRTIDPTDLNSVTPDAVNKTHFVIVDAIGVCESRKSGDTRSLERQKTVPFDKLLLGVAMGKRDEDTMTTLAGRLARLDREITMKDREKIIEISKGKNLRMLSNAFLDAVDPDIQIVKAKELFGTANPDAKQIAESAKQLAEIACIPFDAPELRNSLIEIKRTTEQVIDNVSIDKVLVAEFDEKAKEKSQALISSFRKFIEENKDELTAIKIIYSMPYGQRHLSYQQIKELAEAIEKPPYKFSTDQLWLAFKNLENSRVRNMGPQKLLTNIISLIRFALGKEAVLEPFIDTVEHRFEKWLGHQQTSGRSFSTEQIEWLNLIKKHIAANLAVEMEDFEYAPFSQKGGPLKARLVFGQDLQKILKELSEVLAA